jgi:GH24 family phage-related lysozyme (muramidase)
MSALLSAVESAVRGAMKSFSASPPGPVQQCPFAPRPNEDLSVSDKGLDFIYRKEARKGVSDKLHWPKGNSGVTLGPGYDMKHRTKEEVEADLLAIDVPPAVAKAAAAGAGLRGEEAKQFCADNKELLVLTEDQEKALLRDTVKDYEEHVRKYTKTALTQDQFDAFVSLDYNIGEGNFKGSSALRHANAGEMEEAAESMKLWNKSGGQVMPGLVTRRQEEADMFSGTKQDSPAPAPAPTAAPPLYETPFSWRGTA